jgi:hypothetical protein
MSPAKVPAPQIVAPNELPRPAHPLLKVRCPAEFYRRPNCRVIGFPAPEDLDLSIGPSVFFDRRSPWTCIHGFILPRASRLLQSFERPTACLLSSSNLATAQDQEAPSLGFSPSSRHQPAASTTYPGFPARAHVPSSAFRTPSTVYSATSLAGLFHPAATSRVCPSGVYPSPRSRTGFPRPFHALLPFVRNRLRFNPRQQFRPSTSGLCSPRRVRFLRKAGEGLVQPAPLLGFLLFREFSLHTVEAISRSLRPRSWLR